jgi:hypothetical protein
MNNLPTKVLEARLVMGTPLSADIENAVAYTQTNQKSTPLFDERKNRERDKTKTNKVT